MSQIKIPIKSFLMHISRENIIVVSIQTSILQKKLFCIYQKFSLRDHTHEEKGWTSDILYPLHVFLQNSNDRSLIP